MRPVCVNCGKEMTCKKNSVAVVHFMNNNKKDGIDFIIEGDLWSCDCGNEIITGFGRMNYGMDINQKATLDWYEDRLVEIKR